ncbi:MAG: DUF2802 domain-containing protein [Betaproteobacteria bacterium]|nr:DUF2802 domain-containing protein [Betaproteobacteria bacterium]
MTLILLVFAALIVALQIALTFTLKRMLDLLAATRDEVHGLLLRVQTLEHERDRATPPPSALFTLVPRAEASATHTASSSPSEPPPAPSPDEPTDLPVLHEPAAAISTDAVGAQVRALARQGMPVREIAERCGLSEAEAELIIHLRQEPV